MLVLTRIETNELYGLALIPEAEEGEFLVESWIEMVSFEVIIEGSSKSVVIVVARNSVVPEIWLFLLNLIDF